VLSLLLFGCMTLPAAQAYYPVDGYETNWLNPRMKTNSTASKGNLKAKLTVDSNMFDGQVLDTTKGKLELYVDSKKVQTEFLGPMRGMNGPFLVENENGKKMVLVNVSLPRDADTRYYVYDFDPAKNRFKKRAPRHDSDVSSSSAVDIAYSRANKFGSTSALLKWNSLQTGTQDWEFEIHRGKDRLLSGSLERDFTFAGLPPFKGVQFSGPFIASMNGTGDVQVDLRIDTSLNQPHNDHRVCFDKIYFYDKKTKKLDSYTHYWSGNYPRLADLRKNGKTQFVIEDYQIEHDCWTEEEQAVMVGAGPLQIWQWSQNKKKLLNVTRKYPDEIRKHAAASLAAYKESKKTLSYPGDFYIISYVGDLCLLGEKHKALAELKRLQTANTKKMHKQILYQLKRNGYL
jgi:hypothetical protein